MFEQKEKKEIHFFLSFKEEKSSSKNEPRNDKTCLCHMQTTKVQINLRIRGLISAFVIRCLDNIKPLLAIAKISRL